MTYPDSVRFLYALGNELKTAKLGLERITKLVEALGNPHRRPARFVHVAGTNGKGSVCAMIESGLRAAGLRTGLFTSPHLLEPVERIQIDGTPVSEDEFRKAFDHVHTVAEALLAQGEIDAHPSYFETVTAMGLLLFGDKQVDIAVLEVGLGGRLDATNVIEPELCVITPIDFDHEKFLGSSIESIAAEKAGILKAGVPAVLAPQRAEAQRVLDQRAAEFGVRVIEPWRAESVEADARGSRIETHGMQLECPFAGRHQVLNVMVAAAALEALEVAGGAIRRGISEARWPGRLQVVHIHPTVILDGAHNPAGARALAEYVAEFYPDPAPVLIFGVMRDKAVEEITGILFPHFSKVIVTAPDQPRALAPETYADFVSHPALTTAPNLQAALAQVTDPGATAFVSGSLFLVSEALRMFGS